MTISSDIKLSIYNGALRHLGSRPLASLTENRKPRRELDGAWGSADEAVVLALESGEWNFGIKSVLVDYAPDIETSFGFSRAFSKPDDFARLVAMSADERFHHELTHDQFNDESTYWLADTDVIYARYVSTASDYGLNSAAWPEKFKKYLELYLAHECCEAITNSTAKKDRMQRDMSMAISSAKASDAMNEGVKFFPGGGWSRSRYSGRNSR